jgi:hypothetical protein
MFVKRGHLDFMLSFHEPKIDEKKFFGAPRQFAVIFHRKND